jgi:hypothetical protein
MGRFAMKLFHIAGFVLVAVVLLLALLGGGYFVSQILGAREAAQLNTKIGRMHQVRLGIENYKDHNNSDETSLIADAANVSWRIRLAPFIEERRLYDQYNFSERWDSPANHSLLSAAPRIFRGDNPTQFTQVLLVNPASGSTLLNPQAGPWWILTDERHFRIPWTRPGDVTEEELIDQYVQQVRSRKLKGSEKVVVYIPRAKPEIKDLTIRELLVLLGQEAEL